MLNKGSTYEVLIFKQSDLPDKWFYQVISFLRINWPEGFVGDLQFRNWISRPEYNPVSIMLVTGDILIAHVEVLSKTLTHNHRDYLLFGLSGVLAYPAFRGQGFGEKVVRVGTDHILRQERADVSIITCEPQNVGFYQKCGWRFVDNQVLYGDRANPVASDERVALLYISDKAKAHQADFEAIPIHLEDPW